MSCQFSILFLSTSPSSPFISTPSTTPSIHSSSSVTPDISLPLSSPIPGRPWMSLNGGRIFDPALVGYREITKIIHGKPEPIPNTEPAAEPSSIPETEDKFTRWYDRLFRPSHIPTPKEILPTPIREPTPPPTPNHLPPGYIDLRYKGIGFVLDLGWKRSEEGMAWEVEEWRRSAVSIRRTGEVAEKSVEVERRQEHSLWERIPLLGSW